MLNIKGPKLTYKNIKIPESGEKITLKDGILSVPNNPIIPFIEGDGIGSDITPAMIEVVDTAIELSLIHI